MKGQSQLGRIAKLGAAAVAVTGLGAVSGCLNRPIEPIDPLTTSTVVERLTQSAVNKIDLLFMVDNSASMADKQAILATAVPDLISGLVNPPCLDVTTGNPLPSAQQPSSPTAACPSNSKREFPPILDIHIGMLSSSLGSFGANGCPDSENTCPGNAPNTSTNDHGHLVTRKDPCSGGTVPTYAPGGNPEGFLAWDPSQMLNPPGIADMATLEQDLHDLVVGDGQSGCGFESQNESWYRFLVDPSPYNQIALNSMGVVQTMGTDSALLQQRAEFMRPDSLLAIIMLSDETDTSLKEYGQYPLFAQETTAPPADKQFHLPHATQACTQKGPTDPCCLSCGEKLPPQCADPTCAPPNTNYTDATENLGLRAFGLSGGLMSHKARYGIEWFYQPSRYVQALTSPTVQDATGNVTTNPIFAPNPMYPNATVRDPGLVFYAAITGVPWQLIARQDANGTPDLKGGINPTTMKAEGGFKTFQELNQLDKTGHNTYWDDIVGDPENYVLPLSPYMQESTVPRLDKNGNGLVDPITGTSTSPPQSGAGPNPINGHEWSPVMPAGDIEYACIFPLPTPVDCSAQGTTCDCNVAASADNPLCDPNPNDNMKPTLQTRAKAYPGVKNLAIAKGLGTQGIAASICPAQLTDNTQSDYGYRPAVNAIINRLKQALTGECLPRTLTPDKTGEVPCLILEASTTNSCNCNATARAPVSAAHQPAEAQAKMDPLNATEHWNCFCEITQATGSDLTTCETNANDPPVNPQTNQAVNGWCYVDATIGQSPAAEAAAQKITKNCPQTEQRLIRFVGKGQPDSGSTLFITCEGQ
jgi:hypothetical protein